MKNTLNFNEFWKKYHNKPLTEREKFFTSLQPTEQRSLVKSFFEDGWHEMFICNIVDENIDFIKETYDIDLIDMRIKVLNDNRIFIIDKKVFEHIKELLEPYENYYNSFVLWGGLLIEPWGKKDQFYRISKEN